MNELKSRLVVLVSGNGSNLQAILDACGRGSLQAEVVGVVSNHHHAHALERARQAGVPAYVFVKLKDQDRQAYDARLADLVAGMDPDWVILAGWMRLLSKAFLRHFPNRVVNLHPALPGAFPGVDAIQRAYAAYRAGKIRDTGVMVHLVPDEGVDNGPVLAWERVAIHPDETLESLQTRMHEVEHSLLVRVLQQLVQQKKTEKE